MNVNWKLRRRKRSVNAPRKRVSGSNKSGYAKPNWPKKNANAHKTIVWQPKHWVKRSVNC